MRRPHPKTVPPVTGGDHCLLTVAIPTHAGEARLPSLLDSLVGQEGLRGPFEVLVIDNASPTPLVSVVEPWTDRLRLRVIREERLGLNHARNRALEEANTPVVIFVDDDVRASPGLVTAYEDAFRDDRLDAAGGPIRPALTRPRPVWFRGAVLSLYSTQDLGSATGYGAGYPYGANFAVRRSAVTKPFSPKLDRRGGDLLSGGEAHFFRANRLLPVKHVPAAVVNHLIPSDRLRLSWLIRRGWAQLRTRRVLAALDRAGR
jgi:glycosyltransferase involved in cell wall biosynthesis